MKQLKKEAFKELTQYPSRVIQFGEGNFLRAFVDWQLQQLNNHQLFKGSATVIQPLSKGLKELLDEQNDYYTVILEGLLNGQVVNSHEIMTTIHEVINPYQDYQAYLALAEDDNYRFIFSNTTEAGIAFNEKDQNTEDAEKTYPAKLTQLLYRRFTLKKKGFIIIPCELIDKNGLVLKEYVLKYADLWQLGEAFKQWVLTENIFCSSLVDRIVPGYPKERASKLWEEFGYKDNAMVVAEPFLLWVIEGPKEVAAELPLDKIGLQVIFTDDQTPYRKRKVHLLNGPHTAMTSLALLAGIQTVSEVMKDQDFSVYVDHLMKKEIIPALDLPKEELLQYAEQVQERFKNPFVKHELSSISLNSISKFKTRLLLVLKSYLEKEKKLPLREVASLAGYLFIYQGTRIQPIDNPEVIDFCKKAWETPATAVKTILGNADFWGEDLNQLTGLTEQVQLYVERLGKDEVRTIIQELN